MNTRTDIQDFVAQKTLAVVGMSRAPQSFSAHAAKELRGKGYRLFPVNPNATEVQGEKCYPTLAALPEKVGGVLFLTPPAATEQAVREAVAVGVTHLWIQQGAESNDALAFCEAQNVSVVSGHCILMFAEPVTSFHRVHRFFKGLFGGVPQ
ncbi:MAG: CoA-binding protein [Deltaproteobacteria bacterium]|nr:CoA-binding protein [Deltaproteobacteria bacterium]